MTYNEQTQEEEFADAMFINGQQMRQADLGEAYRRQVWHSKANCSKTLVCCTIIILLL
jgi:hypothetical protein